MNRYNNSTYQTIKKIVEESQNYINLIYVAPCIYARNMLLNQLKAKMSEIEVLCGMELQQQNQNNHRDLTLSELSKFNGKDGSPAYVAVNGIVYDVTNNATWAAASHFGLTAGKDLTSEFASCHAGQSVLSKLKVVGKLI